MTTDVSTGKEHKDAINWCNKGIALFNLGRYEEALKAYDKAIELKPDLVELWNNKGNALRVAIFKISNYID